MKENFKKWALSFVLVTPSMVDDFYLEGLALDEAKMKFSHLHQDLFEKSWDLRNLKKFSLTEDIEQEFSKSHGFFSSGYIKGSNNGYGNGYGSGYGSGYGYGYGYGYAYLPMHGYAYGDSSVSGYGCGHGYYSGYCDYSRTIDSEKNN